MTELANKQEILDLVRLGAIFWVSHSGGKDSQAMYHAITQIVPGHQIRVIHADLGDIEHEGVKEHIAATVDQMPIITRAYKQDGTDQGFFSLVRQRRASLDAQGKFDAPAFPSSAARFCTSDLKTGPIWRTIRQAGDPIVVNCVGIRADESASRAKKVVARGTLNVNKKNTNSKRDAYDWWPIAHWTDNDVWHEIVNEALQEPHPAYRLTWIERTNGIADKFKVMGNERLSCMFCIFGSRGDLKRAARSNPDLLTKYANLEIEVRSTMFHGESLLERIQ